MWNADPFDVFSGFWQRYQLTAESKICQIQSGININMHNQSRLLPPMVKLNYTFHLSDAAFALISHEADTTFNYEIKSAKLIFKRVNILPALTNKFETMLSRQNALFPIYHTSTKRLNIPEKTQEFAYQDLYTGGFCPKTVICGIISQQDIIGHFQDSSPFAFKPYGLKDIWFQVGSNRYPTLPLQLDYVSDPKKYMRGFQTLYQELFSQKGSWIDYNRYLTGGFTLYKIQLGQEEANGEFFSPKQIGPVRVNLSFSK